MVVDTRKLFAVKKVGRRIDVRLTNRAQNVVNAWLDDKEPDRAERLKRVRWLLNIHDRNNLMFVVATALSRIANVNQAEAGWLAEALYPPQKDWRD